VGRHFARAIEVVELASTAYVIAIRLGLHNDLFHSTFMAFRTRRRGIEIQNLRPGVCVMSHANSWNLSRALVIACTTAATVVESMEKQSPSLLRHPPLKTATISRRSGGDENFHVVCASCYLIGCMRPTKAIGGRRPLAVR
jgi:hypothetical protein